MSKSKPFMAHVKAGECHAVTAELQVLVMPAKDGGFLAQGIQIDYAATGCTEEEARQHFAQGFVATLRAYLRRGRSLDGLFKSATPAEYRKAYFSKPVGPTFHVELTEVVSEIGSTDAPVPHCLTFVGHHAIA